jgi:hypothetical protein
MIVLPDDGCKMSAILTIPQTTIERRPKRSRLRPIALGPDNTEPAAGGPERFFRWRRHNGTSQSRDEWRSSTKNASGGYC